MCIPGQLLKRLRSLEVVGRVYAEFAPDRWGENLVPVVADQTGHGCLFGSEVLGNHRENFWREFRSHCLGKMAE